MLIIRQQQMEVFAQAALRYFEDEMVVHSKEFTPRLCEVLGEEQLRLALRQAMTRAETYGFTYRGPIRLYIELMFLCGSHFDTDPQYPQLGAVLRADGDQMQRAEQMHEGYLDYLDKVPGPDAANVHKALRDLSTFARMPLGFAPEDFVPGMLQEMHRLFPQKAAYSGEAGLTALIHEGRAEAQTHGFPSPRGEALMVTLMFAFGHGCADDPLYPWIARTLQDERIVDATARAARLERRALTWLDHVNASNAERAQQ